MPGNNARKLKIQNPQFLYIPLALEIFICFIPFLILGEWYLMRVLGEMTEYEAGMSCITLVRLVEKEAGLFEDRMKDEQLKELDLSMDYQEKILPDMDWNVSSDPIFGMGGIDTAVSSDDIRINYLYVRNDGNLVELNVTNREFSVVPKDTEYYEIVSDALGKKIPQDTLVRTNYRLNDENYYGSFILLMPEKPVYCGDQVLSDGSDGAVILLSGQLSESTAEHDVGYRMLWLTVLSGLIFALTAGTICFVLFWSYRRVQMIINTMEVVCKGGTVLPEYNSRLLSAGEMSDLRKLIENFQIMFLSIRKYKENTSNIREMYEALLPAAFLELFRQDDIRKIKPGDKAFVKGRVLSIRLSSDSKAGTEDISARNTLIKKILKILASVNMIVTELELDHITALGVQETGEGPLPDMKKEIELIQSLNGTDSGADEISVIETEGEFCYTVTGTREHMAIRMEQLSPKEQET